MKLSRIASAPVVAAFLLALTLSIVLGASIAPVDDPYSTLNSRWNGTSALTDRGFLSVSTDLAKTLSSTYTATVLLIIGPTRQFTRIEANSVAAFVREGGLLVIADNFGSSNGLLDFLGLPVKFDGRLLIDPLFYRKEPLFPVISDFSPSKFSTGLGEVVLNYATVLNITAGANVKLLANSSPFSFLDSDHDGKKGPQEPSGSFPVLAELRLGDGTVLLFTSPASLANGLIGEADNSVLVDSIVKQGSRPVPNAQLLLDETHLERSPFMPARVMAQGLVTSILEGGMQLSMKLGLTALGGMIVAARYVYRKPSANAAGKIEPSRTVGSVDVESVLLLHPTWDRERLEYVARELEASLKWRRLREGE